MFVLVGASGPLITSRLKITSYVRQRCLGRDVIFTFAVSVKCKTLPASKRVLKLLNEFDYRVAFILM